VIPATHPRGTRFLIVVGLLENHASIFLGPLAWLADGKYQGHRSGLRPPVAWYGRFEELLRYTLSLGGHSGWHGVSLKARMEANLPKTAGVKGSNILTIWDVHVYPPSLC
jgi:hypothetical protein